MTTTAKARRIAAATAGKMILDAFPGAKVEFAQNSKYRYNTVKTEFGFAGLGCSMEFASDHDYVLIHWYTVKGGKFSPTFTDSYNQYHGGKATTNADNVDQLYTKLASCLKALAAGTAFV